MGKSRPRKATVMTPIKDLKGKDTIEHYNAVLIEELRSNSRLVIEKVESSEASLRQEMGEIRDEFTERFDIIEAVVTEHTKILKEHGKKLDEHGKDLTEIKKTLLTYDAKIASVESSIKHIDEKVSNVESAIKHLDAKVSEKFDDHEMRIVTLEKSAILP